MKSKKPKFKISNIALIAIVLTVVLSSVAIYEYVQLRFGTSYQQALAAQNPSDICATPAGYTDAEWRTHMSHHPSMYAQCLK